MMRYMHLGRKDTVMQDAKTNKNLISHILKTVVVTVLCFVFVSACTQKDSEKNKLPFVDTLKESFEEQVVYDGNPNIGFIMKNPNKQSAFKFIAIFDGDSKRYGLLKLPQDFKVHASDFHPLNSMEEVVLSRAFWDGNKFLFVGNTFLTEGEHSKIGVFDNQQMLWTNKDIKSFDYDSIAMFRGKDERLYTVSIEFPEFYSYATQKLVIRNAHDGTEVRSLILQTHDDNAPDRSVSLNLDQGGHLEEIAVYTSNLKIYYGIDENYADIYDENLQKLRRITETSNNVMHVLDWPTSKQKAYVFQAATITVKNAQNQVVYKGDRLENTCVSSYHYDVETVQFQKGKSYLAVLSTGTYECHQVVLSILNDKAELVYQKEMPRFSSMTKIDIGDNQQGLLLAKQEGLTLMTLPLPSSNAQTPVH